MADTTDSTPGEPYGPLHPDAELIGICEQVVELERRWAEAGAYDELGDTPRARKANAEQRRLAEAQDRLKERVNKLPTHTLAGYRARARAILCSSYGQVQASGDGHGMLWALLNDLTEGSYERASYQASEAAS